MQVPVAAAGLAAVAAHARGLPVQSGKRVQSDAPAEDRAGVLSLNTLLLRLISVFVLPPVGALADARVWKHRSAWREPCLSFRAGRLGRICPRA
jgi:hypothetical protein